MSEWKKVKFGNVVEFPPAIKLEKNIEYPFVELADINIGFKYVYSKENKVYSGSGSKFENGDTLFARITPSLENGKIAQIKGLTNAGFGSGEFFIFRGKNDVTDSDFIYYLSQTKAFQDHAINSMVGASGRQRADNKFVARTELFLPPLPTQKKIAQILSNYDDLIENNLKRIKLLEESARLTYEEWFLRFRIDGEKLEIDSETGLPFGWEKKKAIEVLSVNIGKTPPRGETQWFTENNKGVKWISIKDMKKSSTYIFNSSEEITSEGVAKHNMHLAKLGTVLLSFKLTVGEVRIVTEDVVTNEAIAHMNIKKDSKLFEEYIFSYLKSFNFDTLGSTSSIGTAINSKIVKAMPIIVPTTKILNQFKELIQPVFYEIKNLQTQNQLLKEARDILLPRLMTGMIEVDNMEVAV